LNASRVWSIGFEHIDRNGTVRRAEDALARAKEANIDVLPYPRVGQPYDFEVTTMDHGVVSSTKWRGKIGLIYFWGTWCAPCVEKIPELQEILKSHRPQGIEFLGVSADGNEARVRKAMKALNVSWPNIDKPSDPKFEQLWLEATGLEQVPRILIIDRTGKLRADIKTTAELRKELEELFE